MGTYKKLSWTESDVKCPFFISESRETRSVRCEGCFKGMRIQIMFRSIRARDSFMGRHCCTLSGYPGCPYYRLTRTKYEHDELER